MFTILLAIIVLAQIALLSFCIIFIIYFSSAFITWPPSIPSDRKSRKKIVEEIGSVFKEGEEFNIADLGSGYGHLVRDISRKFPNAKVTGVELLWLPYLGGKLLCSRFKNIKIIKSDLFNYNLADQDSVVYFFKTSEKLDEKLDNEIKKGVTVISNNFPMKNRKADKIIEMKETFVNRKIYIYKF